MIGNQQKERFGKRGELLKGLTGGQIAKVKAYKSQEKMLAFAKGGCIELTNDQLEAIPAADAISRLMKRIKIVRNGAIAS